MEMFKVELNNGAEVLDWRLRPGGAGERALIGKVIAKLPDHEYHKYATWSIASRDDGTFDAWTGGYWDTESEAYADFYQRRMP